MFNFAQQPRGLFGSASPYGTPPMPQQQQADPFVSMPQAPAQSPTHPGLFGQGGVGRSIAGNIGDVLLQYAHMQPIYQPAMQAQQEQATWGKRLDAQDKQWYQHQQYEADHPKPVNNDTVNDVNWYMHASPEEKAAYDALHPVFHIGPDGIPYPIARSAGGAPPPDTLPADFDFGGAAPSARPPFGADTITGITAQSESGNRDYLPSGAPVTSAKGALYKMQVMPSTAHDPGYGVRPVQNESAAEYDRVGRDYQAAMLKRYGGDPAKMWAAYNGGPGRVDRGVALPTETQNYVAHNMRRLRGN